MTPDSSQTIATSAARFFSGTLFSRVTGFVREIGMAAAFGTAPEVAAFWMAFRFAYLLRRLFGEGGLHVAFIPHFERLRAEDPQKGAQFFNQLSNGLALLLFTLTVVAEGILGLILIYGTGSEIIRLTMILLPALTFISLYALNAAFLNCERHYFVPSFAPTILNLTWIVSILFLLHQPLGQALEWLAMIVTFAFALQWLLTVPLTYRTLGKGLPPEWWVREKKGGGLMPLLKPFSLALIGVAATQINSALDALFARAADPEGPAYLWYAIRLQQLPLALFGVGLTGALLPPISRAISSGEWGKAREFLHFASVRTITLMIPCTAALVALGFAGVNLAYGHGAFSYHASIETTRCLWAYGIGLFPMTAVLIFSTPFYALKNYKTPALISLLSVACNAALNALFVFGLGMGAQSIAIATSLSACLNAALLFYFLRKKIANSGGVPFVKVTLCSFFAAGAVFAFYGITPYPSPSLLNQLIYFTLEAFTFLSTLLISAYLLRAQELLAFFPPLKRRNFSSK